MSESNVLKRAMLALSKAGVVIFRNQVGQYKLADGRIIRSGLCVGSSDLIGWRSVTITQDMVGQQIAQFVAIETKTDARKTKATDEQLNFINQVNKAGGFALVTNDPDNLSKLLR